LLGRRLCVLRLGLGRLHLRRLPVYRFGFLSSPPLGALPVAAHRGTHLVEEALLTHAARSSPPVVRILAGAPEAAAEETTTGA
jgi:hypothetical protein